MVRKAPENVQAAANDLYVRRGSYIGAFEDVVSMAYRAGARAALERFRDQACYRRDYHYAPAQDPFVLGKLTGYDWAVDAAQFLIDEYKEEK